MKVTFVQPPIEDFYSTPIRRQPLGLLSLAAIAQQNNWQTSLINGHSPKKKIIPLPEQFDYLKQYIDEPDPKFRFPFKYYYRFGTSYQEIARQIADHTTDLYAISSLFTPYHEETEKIIHLIRERQPDSLIAVGGGHATLHPQETIKAGADFVILGEGEIPFKNLLQQIKQNNQIAAISIPGIITKKGPSKAVIQPVEDLNLLPIAKRSLLRSRDFKIYKQKGTSLVYSRGCPNNCSFCSSRHIFGNKYRTRSVPHLLKEIKECIEKHGISFFNFEDDNLFAFPDQAETLLKALIEFQNINSYKLDLSAMNGLSIENITLEMLPLLQKAGFKELNLSLVTAGKNLQNSLLRPFDSLHFEQIATHAKKIGFNVRGYFILGHPRQTKTEIEETIKFFSKIGIKGIPSVFYNPHSNKKRLWKIQRSSAFANPTDHLTRRDLIYYFNKIIFS